MCGIYCNQWSWAQKRFEKSNKFKVNRTNEINKSTNCLKGQANDTLNIHEGEYFGKKVKGKNESKFGQIKLNSKQVHAIQSELSEPSDSIALWQNELGCLTLICPNPWCTC